MNYDELYDTYVTKHSDTFERVLIDREEVEKISSFVVNDIIKAKQTESQHLIDHAKESKRFTTGFLGEAALEKLFNIDIIDWTVGDSKAYHHPDIPGYNIGIKTVEKGKFPIIFKRNYYPQILCIKSDQYSNLIFVCGLAVPEVLNKYQDDNLILDPNLRRRGTKTGFYGFQYLTPIHSLDDIAKYKK